MDIVDEIEAANGPKALIEVNPTGPTGQCTMHHDTTVTTSLPESILDVADAKIACRGCRCAGLPGILLKDRLGDS